MTKAALGRCARGLFLRAILVGATAPAPACALVIVSARNSENLTKPNDDPGWANVGSVSALTGIYLGNGWMLTASHVGTGPVILGGRTFSPRPDSTVQLRNQDGSLADLIVFRIQGAPHLPKLQIALTSPAVGTPVVLIGRGRNRGAPIAWSGHEGFAWGTASALRWGTNIVLRSELRVNATQAFATQFRKDDATPYEAQAALGDSGGAVFVKVRGKWLLAGVLYMVAGFDKQPPETALYGNFTLSADLAQYRPQIEKLTAKRLNASRGKSREGHPR